MRVRIRLFLIVALGLSLAGCGQVKVASATKATAPGAAAPAITKATAPGAAPANVGVAVGNTAPEIEGEDLDGKAFKLSDYRGKVVLLDFWASW